MGLAGFVNRHSRAVYIVFLAAAGLAAAYVLGVIAGNGLSVTYATVTTVKPRRISLYEFPGAEAVFVSGTCYNRSFFNGSSYFSSPPIRDGDIKCSLVPRYGVYMCNGTGYIYRYNYVCSEMLSRSHPVSDHYYHGVPGDVVHVAVYTTSVSSYAAATAFLVNMVIAYEIYRRSRAAAAAASSIYAILSYIVAYNEAVRQDLLAEALAEKAVYLPAAYLLSFIASALAAEAALRRRGGSRHSSGR